MVVLGLLGAWLAVEAAVSAAAGAGVVIGAGVLGMAVARGAGDSAGAGVTGAAMDGLGLRVDALIAGLELLAAFAGLLAAVLLGAGAGGADFTTAAGGAAAGTLASATFVAGSAAGVLATSVAGVALDSVAT